MARARTGKELLRLQRLHRNTAALIRMEFILARRQAEELQTGKPCKYKPGPRDDGGRDRYDRSHVHQPIWPKIAEFVLKHRLEPHAFVERQFLYFERSGWLTPAQLLGPPALERYRRGEAQDSAMIKLAFTIQRRRFLADASRWRELAETDEMGSIEMALLDEDAPLSGLFRYCVARRENLDELTAHFELDAVVQYMRHADHYDQHWGAWLPEGFRSQAEKHYRRILAAT